MGNGSLILIVRKFWLSDITVKRRSIFTVWKGKECGLYSKGIVGGII